MCNPNLLQTKIMNTPRSLAILILFLCTCLPATAMYMRPDLHDIPLERLLANLEERVKAAPTDVEALHQLARTHAMAYARKVGDADSVKTVKQYPGRELVQLWFGFEAPPVQFHRSKWP